jgi:hypothetical protein
MLVRKPLGRLGEDDSDSGFDWGSLIGTVVSAGGNIASSLINKSTASSPAAQQLSTQTLQARTSLASQSLAVQSSNTNMLILGGLGMVALVVLLGNRK